jgi:hypothetical protein
MRSAASAVNTGGAYQRTSTFVAMQDRSFVVQKRLIIAATLILVSPLTACLEATIEYGPVNGLRVRGTDDAAGANCSLPPGADATGNTCPDWSTVIFPMFRDTYGCIDDGCHIGATGAANLTMLIDPLGTPNAADSYDALANYVRGTPPNDRPYVGAQNAYVLCNLWGESPERIDPLMPITSAVVPLLALEDIVIVANWSACGSPESGSGTPIGGAGGVGGAGGAGGAGQ